MQARGGQGKAAARLKDDDAMESVVRLRNHDHMIFFRCGGVHKKDGVQHTGNQSRSFPCVCGPLYGFEGRPGYACWQGALTCHRVGCSAAPGARWP